MIFNLTLTDLRRYTSGLGYSFRQNASMISTRVQFDLLSRDYFYHIEILRMLKSVDKITLLEIAFVFLNIINNSIDYESDFMTLQGITSLFQEGSLIYKVALEMLLAITAEH